MQAPSLLLTFLLNGIHKTVWVAYFQGDLLYVKPTNQPKAKLVYYLHWHSPQLTVISSLVGVERNKQKQ